MAAANARARIAQKLRGVALAQQVTPVLFLLVAWKCGSWALGEARLPGPVQSVQLLISSTASNPIIETQGGGSMGYAPHVFSTFWHVLLGGNVGFLIGLAAALLAAQNSFALAGANVVLEMVRTVPPLIFVPFATIGLGPSDLVQTASVGLYSALTIALYSLAALSTLPVEYSQLGQLLGASRFRRILTIQIPGILPQLLGPVRLVFSLGLGISIVAEYLAAPTGIGRVMKYSVAYSDAGLIVVGVLWTILLAIAFDLIAVLLFSVAMRWTERKELLKWMSVEVG